ncbi:hypothetical protein D3C86_1881700 [compost metagenome]
MERNFLASQPRRDSMGQFHHQLMTPALCVGSCVARLQGNHHLPRLFSVVELIVIEQQIPESGEAVHCFAQGACIKQARAQVFEGAAANTTGELPHHLVIRTQCHLLIQAHELIVSHPCTWRLQ